MSVLRCPSAIGALLLAWAPPLAAQGRDSSEAIALVRRAVDQRAAVAADSALLSYRTRAHGFVFFLAQVGEGLTEPPRLVKADELDVEVYWQAPDRSKQVVLGWRDGAFLPTDIEYHRDHLGIVTNNFGDVIRIGEGDEVRDAIHPLSLAGLVLYHFALGDSLTIRTGGGEVTVREVQVRPRSFQRPLVVGTMFLDTETAELVRFRFSFTPSAYLDRQVEDITIALENARIEGRWWLPYRQEIEIRRRASYFDFPARGIIRGRWEIEDYDLNVPIPPEVRAGPAIGGLGRPQPGDSGWEQPLSEAIADVAAPVNQQDMAALRVEVERIAGARALGGLPSSRLATGALSDLARVNRVQGLALGFGATVGVGGRVSLRPKIGYGTSDERVTGGLRLLAGTGATQISLGADRQIRDFADFPVISPILNSLLAQEAGDDHGDYVLLDAATAGVRHRLGGRTAVELQLGVEESQSVDVTSTPANGSYRPNPPLGAGTLWIARATLERASGGMAVRRDLQGRLSLEGGTGDGEYLRAAVEGRWLTGGGPGPLLTRFYAGAGTDELPAYRSFALGGRGTLLGEPFRAFGGRTMALVQTEWRLEVPVPALALGSFAGTGRHLTLAPFLAAGWSERPLPGLPYTATDGVRPVVGLAAEWLMGLLRFELGVGLRSGDVGISVDVNRDWWGIL
ncbi:MAG TPA: hypothetical protein VFR62_02285 [Gemmatimonadales bacterium]|nr:hypothetical protein [Gemmatimonadales bacterium]